MKEVHFSAFDSWHKFDHNTCEFSYFADDMFETFKRQKGFFFSFSYIWNWGHGLFFKKYSLMWS
jgi:hypothetical protein